MIGRSSGLLFALIAGAGLLHAQTMRSFSSARQVHGETQLTAKVQLTAGSLRLAPGGASTLYHLEVIYDADRFSPSGRYDAVAGEVVLGLESIGGGGLRVSKATQLGQAANVVFSPSVDLTLDARLEAVNAELELGGLRLVGFTVSNGGSKTVARFTSPNRVRCSAGVFRAGAAEFRVMGLGNSRCDTIRFDGGVGATVLDFSGSWRQGMTLEARMAAGGLTLRLPRGVGVRMTTDNFLALLDPKGFEKQGDAYVTGDYQDAERRLDVSLKTSLGQVKIEWIDPAPGN
jgi:hypothetical protein